jgi:hypothetical protein
VGDFEGYDVVGRRRGRALTRRQQAALAVVFLTIGGICVMQTGDWNWLAIFGGPALGLLLRMAIWRDRG